MKELLKKNKIIFIGTFIFLLLLFTEIIPFGGIDIFSILMTVFSFIVMFPILAGGFIAIKKIFESKRPLLAISGIAILFAFSITIIGIILLFAGTAFTSEYNEDNVLVNNTSWNSVEIDYTKYNHGDNKTITIKKPLFARVKKGDEIKVRYPINHPEKMSYVIDYTIGETLLILGSFMLQVLMVIIFMMFIIYIIKERKRNGKK